MKQVLLVLALTFASTPAFSLVDMENANYADSWVDLIVSGTGYDLRVLRTYNSRSLHNGIFGFGWCSDFETSLELTSENSILVTHCGSGEVTEYYPAGATPAREKVVDQIVAEKKKKAKGSVPDSFWAKMKKDLLFDEYNRKQEAEALNLKTAKAEKGKVYLANGSETERVVYKGNRFVRYLNDATVQLFDEKGALIKLSDRNGNSLDIKRKKGRISEIIDNNGRKLTIALYPNGKVKSVTAPGGIKSIYKYKNLDDLAEVTNAWGNTYKYEYDDLHNMTKTIYPDKTSRVLTYNQKKDWVTSFKNRSNCLETYKYGFDKKQPQLHYWADVKKVCNKKTMAENRYEFWFKKDKSGQAVLAKTKSKEGNRVTEIAYHPEFGSPQAVSVNGVKTKYKYYKNGLIHVKETASRRSTFNYEEKFNKVKALKTEILNPKGKPVKVVKTKFEYDPKGNLKRAANSDGQKVALTYDTKGRISKIVDQAKRIVTIQYDDRFGKPKVVTRQGLGTIQVSYQANGEIDKVDSKEGPVVALQVASAFNNLLDIIGPATADLNL
jgi:YD repeat-containing protein